MDTTNQRTKWILIAAVTVVIGVTIVVVAFATLRRGSGITPVTTVTSTSTPSGSAPERPGGGDKGGDSNKLSGPAQVRDEFVQMGLIQREYLVLTPEADQRGPRLPLVVALHGLGVDRTGMLDAADWRTAVAERGFVAVFPQGFGNSWNVGPCCLPANILGLDDIGFLDAVIQKVASEENIDEDQVFMTGFSAGALMTYRYGCDRADKLAAIGPIAGVNLTGCEPAQPLSLLHQHGDPDLVIPFDGSLGVGQLISSEALPPVIDSVGKWADVDGCQTDPRPWEKLSAGVESRSWSGCRDGTQVELVRLENLGHEWPRMGDYDGLEEMLDFFGIN